MSPKDVQVWAHIAGHVSITRSTSPNPIFPLIAFPPVS